MIIQKVGFTISKWLKGQKIKSKEKHLKNHDTVRKKVSSSWNHF